MKDLLQMFSDGTWLMFIPLGLFAWFITRFIWWLIKPFWKFFAVVGLLFALCTTANSPGAFWSIAGLGLVILPFAALIQTVMHFCRGVDNTLTKGSKDNPIYYKQV